MKINPQTLKKSTASPLAKCLGTLVLVFSLLSVTNCSIYAQSNTDEAQILSTNIYLPIINDQNPTTFYVSPSGSDSNPGTLRQPWRTIDKAMREVGPGYVIYLRGGIYQESVDVYRSGTSNKPITIRAYPGETPVIDGKNFSIPSSLWGPLLKLSGDYIRVSGVEVRYSRGIGVIMLGTHDIVENMNSHHNKENGIVIKGDYGSVLYSRVWQNALTNENGNGADWSGGITACRDDVNGTTAHALIRGNTVWENWGEGISTFEADGTVIENNSSYDNWSANVYIHDATNILLQRNLIYSTGALESGHQSGILMGEEYNIRSVNITIINNIVFNNNKNFYWWDSANHDGLVNTLIANNTFVNSTGTSGVKILSGNHVNVNFINNLVAQDGDLPVIFVEADNPELHFSHNLWSKEPPPEASGPGDVIDDPKLAHIGDPNSADWFTLTELSPAIDKALSLSQVSVDYFGYNREATPDIGADEFFPVP